jgi:hypothetical protein
MEAIIIMAAAYKGVAAVRQLRNVHKDTGRHLCAKAAIALTFLGYRRYGQVSLPA